ncbi:MAG: VanW family protein [Lachnospiraceae bacterium]|nr:VanW family protein [Lachnospiraceae bacterium]
MTVLTAVCLIADPVYAGSIDIKIGGAGIGLSTDVPGEDDTGPGTGDTSVDISIGAPSVSVSPAPAETGRDSLGTSYNTVAPDLANSHTTMNINMSDKITDHVYADTVDLSGLSYTQAETAIAGYITGLRTGQITLAGINDSVKTVSAGDLGVSWANTDILESAIALGKSGNLVSRYKEIKDLAHDEKKFDIKLSFDRAKVRQIVEGIAAETNVKPVSPVVKRVDGAFVMLEEGQTGIVVDVEESVNKILRELSGWKGESKRVDLVIDVEEPKGTVEEFAHMTDILGSFSTSFSSSGSDRSGNVRNGTKLVNGTLLYPGEQFSMYKTVSPFTEENGYFLAGSYLNGIVVESLGGGICQVSSTLYNAVLRAELQVDERYNHSMIVTYVKLSSDAAIAGTTKDFKFTNTKSTPIYIEGYTTDDKQIVFNIYGIEDRPANRTVEFESVEISKTEAEGENIVADSSLPVGSISTQSAHTGYVGELWKIVKVDGVETERTQINKSNYKMVPKTATVGTAADDPAITQAVQAAIATGSIDNVKATIAQLQALASGTISPADLVPPEALLPPPAPAEEPAPAPEPPAEAAFAAENPEGE